MFHGYVSHDVQKKLAKFSYFHRQLRFKEIIEILWSGQRKRHRCLCANQKKYFHWVSSILCNISLYILHMKLRQVVLLSKGGCFIQKEQWWAIWQKLKDLLEKNLNSRSQHTSQAIALHKNTTHLLKRRDTMMMNERHLRVVIFYFSNERQNSWSTQAYQLTMEEQKSSLLYMFLNMLEMDKYSV